MLVQSQTGFDFTDRPIEREKPTDHGPSKKYIDRDNGACVALSPADDRRKEVENHASDNKANCVRGRVVHLCGRK